VIPIDRVRVLFDLDQRLQRTGTWPWARLRACSCTVGLMTALIIMGDARDANAVPLTPFRYEAQAQQHCPADTVVWLDFRKRTYYSKGQKRYTRGLDGAFVCGSEARASGYRRSLFGVR
jgi:hypothetical protein